MRPGGHIRPAIVQENTVLTCMFFIIVYMSIKHRIYTLHTYVCTHVYILFTHKTINKSIPCMCNYLCMYIHEDRRTPIIS